MPRFPVNFRRKSTAEDPHGPIAEPSFRVLERSQVSTGKSFDGGARLAKMTAGAPKSNIPDIAVEDNLFAGLKNNRGSGSSNTTKTASDNSSRHSNASTAPSSTDFPPQEDWRNTGRKPASTMESSVPPPHKNSGGFLRQAGRTFSFGSKKSALPTILAEESVPAVPTMPDEYNPRTPTGRSRAETASTVSTATPPQVEDRDFMLDLGGDLSSMLKFDKRASVATVKERSLMSNRVSQPSPLHLDHSAPVEPPQHSWNSQHSTDGLLGTGRTLTSPLPTHDMPPPPVPRHGDGLLGRRRSDEDDEDTTLLKDSIAATQYLSSSASGPSGNSSRYRRDEDTLPSFRSGLTESYSKPSRFDTKTDDDNLFDRHVSRPKFAPKLGPRSNSQPQNKVMTPAEFEKYRQDKAREEILGLADEKESDKEDEDNYDDDEDEREKTRQLAKQRRKQEAHMTVYRQQMMKVTGESSANTHVSRPSLSMSMSTPNLVLNDGASKGVSPSPPSDVSDEDEEVPLAILAAHGFPNRNRPPTRLTNMSSNPNLRASVAQPSYVAGPGSTAGESNGQGGDNGARLPPFARKLPQDPYLGAGLINQPPRESFALGGGAAAPSRSLPTGGLVGVIASEERSRAMRRGSPAVDNSRNTPPFNIQGNGMPMNGGFDPINGIPPQMMYPMGMPQMPSQMLTPGDQAQIQMTQQMQQFMQMQMQFMQMMASQGQGPEQIQGHLRPQGHMPTQSMGSLGDAPRNSFMGDGMANNMGNGMNLGLPMGDTQMRTMSMVQPSSTSWIQPPKAGYAPSILAQGMGYAPSIAPSERSNIGLPGRYRPVSSVAMLDNGRTTSMSGAMPIMHSKLQAEMKVSAVAKEDDDDDEQGWEAMKAKREKKRSLWRSKKSFGHDIGALIS
ncbi:hypothetical protein F4820DRAFT_458650 [Hypoxylon rubiginosum]|uniref:Uncharacterized protein n=1 Tax=Hypoxylon rubiginosum TaxID=110542 RepID=A0ACB9Z0L4_9PEZI|nr:hypothetical protein F4820DRAFT_458650 [Hypoxylon rubiginosum]